MTHLLNPTHTQIREKKQLDVLVPTVDLALAERLLRGKDSSYALKAFICHLSIAARQGHLCVTIESPKIKDLWSLVISEEVDWDYLEALVVQGSKEIVEGLSIVQDGNRFYFERYFEDETLLIDHFLRILNSEAACKISDVKTDNLLPEQALAVENCSKHTLSIIYGGPGTGKTHTIGAFLKKLPPDIEIILAAPTGKAAANLEASVGRSSVKAKTLHSLLGINRKRGLAKKLSADLVIVDECSMVDAYMMQRLFSSIKTGCRLILLGDPHQLPPVEAGCLFGDLINAAPQIATKLEKCLRSESKEIIDCAKQINNGDSAIIFSDLDQFNFPQIPSCTPEECLEQISKFRILSPLRKGLYGVDTINKRYLQKALTQARGMGPHVFPILVVGNDPKVELFNGELGVLVRFGSIYDLNPKKGDYALFANKRLPALLLPKYEYAYCLSVHKSQGSEFDHVVLLMPKGSEVFGRKVLYTGVTRAKKKLEVWSSFDVLNQTVAHDFPRMSGLTDRLVLRYQ